MKKFIAMALFFVSAMTMSAQGVLTIQNFGVTPDDAITLLKESNELGVLLNSLKDAQGNVVLSQQIEDARKVVNDKVLIGQITDKAVAIDEFTAALEVMEKKTGDINLDGDFDVFDVDDLYEGMFDPSLAFDFNGDGDIDVFDVDDLYEALFN